LPPVPRYLWAHHSLPTQEGLGAYSTCAIHGELDSDSPSGSEKDKTREIKEGRNGSHVGPTSDCVLEQVSAGLNQLMNSRFDVPVPRLLWHTCTSSDLGKGPNSLFSVLVGSQWLQGQGAVRN
jgi:hypothetical protein